MSDEERPSANDESWQLFETALQLAIRRGDYRPAFAMAERARATQPGRAASQLGYSFTGDMRSWQRETMKPSSR